MRIAVWIKTKALGKGLRTLNIEHVISPVTGEEPNANYHIKESLVKDFNTARDNVNDFLDNKTHRLSRTIGQ